jgi:hypothetical protein
MNRNSIRAALGLALLASALGASAQAASDLAQAQADFNQQIAVCNSGKLPAPQREACVRDAGAALDAARGGPASTTTQRTPDGRATVVVPDGAPVPSGGTDRMRSNDRRSTVILPADQPRQP